MSDTLIKELRLALSEAIQECIEHNKEYHHRTPQGTISGWEELVEKNRSAVPPVAGWTKSELSEDLSRLGGPR